MIRTCIKYFVISRLLYIFFIILPINKFLVGEYDLSNNLINKVEVSQMFYQQKFSFFNETQTDAILNFENFKTGEKYLLKFLKHFNSYDTIHFLHLAKNGYSNEKNFVFFPIFPKLVEYAEKFLLVKYLLGFENELTSFLLIGFLLNNAICLLNTFLLLRLNLFLGYTDENGKYLVFIYLINPGVIFNISTYSENLYFFIHLTLLIYMLVNMNSGILMGSKEENSGKFFWTTSLSNIVSISVFTILSSLTRSNSLFLLIYFTIPIMAKLISLQFHEKIYENLKLIIATLLNNKSLIIKCLFYGVQGLVCFFFMTNLYPKSHICTSIINDYFDFKDFYVNNKSYFSTNSTSELLYRQKNLIEKGNQWKDICGYKITQYDLFSKENDKDLILDEIPHYMSIIKEYVKYSKFTSIYSFLQKKFWNVSFLSQFRMDHLDRIILASPIIIISLILIGSILRAINFENLKRLNFTNLFLLNDEQMILYKNIKKCDKNHKHENEKIEEKIEKEEARQRELVKIREIFIFYTLINYIINFILVVFVAHTQIINRVLTCNPLIYFFCAESVIDYKYHNSKLGKYILISFISISIIGCVLHPGGYGFA